MNSILKGVLTPAKWAAKKAVHELLLTFPGKDPHPVEACVYCPEMCRFSCPVAVETGNDAVTPLNKMSILFKKKNWPERVSKPLWPIYDCTGCGRCTEYCKYEIPVADTLFKARSVEKWDRAATGLTSLPPALDPCGDLAFELGSPEIGRQRGQAFFEISKSSPGVLKGIEPKSLEYFRSTLGIALSETWIDRLSRGKYEVSPDLTANLKKAKRWLVVESPWLSRRLGMDVAVRDWVNFVKQKSNNEWVWPMAQGRDCIDSGGEGAYKYLFSNQAKKMAQNVWEYDSHRADGIIVWSLRSAAHFKEAGMEKPILVAGDFI